MTYLIPIRSWDDVQHESLRREVDPDFNVAHDELSACYYGHQPFRTYGTLDRELFDKLHSLIWHLHLVAFHDANMARPKSKQIPQSAYNYIYADDAITVVGTWYEREQQKIALLKQQGVTLQI